MTFHCTLTDAQHSKQSEERFEGSSEDQEPSPKVIDSKLQTSNLVSYTEPQSRVSQTRENIYIYFE